MKDRQSHLESVPNAGGSIRTGLVHRTNQGDRLKVRHAGSTATLSAGAPGRRHGARRRQCLMPRPTCTADVDRVPNAIAGT
jgi:hypothetical protein